MPPDGFPSLLRRWRVARRLSQEQLASSAEVSTRHLSCLENDKARPSREMVLILANALDLPLDERNALLSSAGFAAVYTSNALESLELAPVRRAIELVMAQQEPFGAVLFDRVWNAIRLNQGATRLLGSFIDLATTPPHVAMNLVRALLHPLGLRPHLVNWEEVASSALERLERECTVYPHDRERRALLDEVRTIPGVDKIRAMTPATGAPASIVHLRRGDLELRLFTMLTTLGTPLDVTAQELTIESYFPADEATDTWFRRWGEDVGGA
jgi:transcriptional regulator with XRE-family HTH domain